MFLGIDLGTSSIKLLIADDNGKIIASESQGYETYYPKSDWSEQNPQDWYNACLICLKKLSIYYDIKQIKGISFCGQMHGLVILDKNNRVIRPAILWNDNRTIKQCDYLNNEIGKENLLMWTGNIAFTGFTAPKILWLKDNEPENFNKISKIMLPKDYLAFKLSGVFASDVSDLSGTLFFDVKNKQWSNKMLEILKISKNQLPEIYESYQAIGTVSEKTAKKTGLSKNCKVIIGGGDQAVGAIGTGTVGNNRFSISLGTSGVIFASCDNFYKINKGALHSFCHANGNYHIMGVMLSAAGSLQWWVNNVLENKNYDAVLNDIAYSKAENLYFLPYLSGERSPINNPMAKGVFFGLSASHTKEDLTRAIIEGVCFSFIDCFNVIKNLGIKPISARVIGGGAKSKIWLQILSDCLGIELKTINTAEGGGLGAIILAMTGTGVFSSVEQGCEKLIKDELVFVPNKEKTAYYAEKFKKYKAIYESTKNLL